jgi:hypothetical protein
MLGCGLRILNSSDGGFLQNELSDQRRAIGKLKFDIQKTFAPCTVGCAILGCF